MAVMAAGAVGGYFGGRTAASGIALASIPASASAASNTFRATSVSASTCPVDEGPAGCGG